MQTILEVVGLFTGKSHISVVMRTYFFAGFVRFTAYVTHSLFFSAGSSEFHVHDVERQFTCGCKNVAGKKYHRSRKFHVLKFSHLVILCHDIFMEWDFL